MPVGCNHDHKANLDQEQSAEVEAAFNKLVKQVWDQVVSTGLAELTQAVGRVIYKGFNKSFINYNRPDYVALSHIRANVFAFSHAKSLVEMKALSNLVVDKDKIRSFNDYKVEAAKIGQQFNTNYLRTEYETVVASGQMARRYQDIINDKEVFPLLRWDAVNDSRTRPEHRKLDGIIRPADDPFWYSYWPPAGYGCRCDVQQLRTGRVTPKANAFAKAKDVVNNKSPFIGNSAVQGEVFGINHPYFGESQIKRKTLFDLKPKDYGLRSIDKIYSKSNQPALKQGFTSKKGWLDHFAKLYNQMDGQGGNITITDALDRPLLMSADVIGSDHSQSRYGLGGSILDVLTDPDEVYSNYHKGSRDAKKLFGFKYLKFYKDKPVIVTVVPEGTNMRVKTVYQPALNQVGKDRKGILHYVDRY